MEDKEARKVLDIQIQNQMKQDYLNYSMSVIIGRALPDVRDGLKPVQRRILYAMYDIGIKYSQPHKKSARVVGDVLGKYHPHGDTAVYDAMARMAQDFSLRYPLIDGQGNFGSLDGDSPAAMRYTEVRLARLAEEIIADIEKDTVDFSDNFDGSMKEPEVLPSKIPNLLINGTSGIAVGMATKIPPHNLSEVVNALIKLIDNPEVSTKELMSYIKGPDFPTGGEIVGREGIYEAYDTGRGKIKIKGSARIIEEERLIIIDSIPYQVKKSKIVEQIANLVKEERLDGISDVRDESDREGIRVVVELKKGFNPDIILNKIFKNTSLKKTFGIYSLCIVDNEPKTLTLKGMLNEFLKHRVNVVRRRTKYLLRKAKKRLHKIEGLLLAVENIEDIVDLIQNSEKREEAKEKLIYNFELSKKQADAILRMRMQRLTGLEKKNLETEKENVSTDIGRYEKLLSSRETILDEIKNELTEIRKKYGDERKTKIVEERGNISEIDLIPNEKNVVFLSKSGYIKRMPFDSFRLQGRGGTGIILTDLKDGDSVKSIIAPSSRDYLLLFTNFGKVYWLRAYQVPEYSRRSKGTPIVNLLSYLEDEEEIHSIIPVSDLDEDADLVFATKKGYVNRTALEKFNNPRSSGIIAIDLEDDDRLVDVGLMEEKKDILLATKRGKLSRFPASEVRKTGRNTKGVIGMRLEGKDEVVSVSTPTSKYSGGMLVVSSEGYGKITPIDKYSTHHRGGKGVYTFKTGEKVGFVKQIEYLNEDRKLLIGTKKGMMIKTKTSEISVQSRNTQGVKLISLKEGDKVSDVEVVD